MKPDPILETFHRQAVACLELGSPFTARICKLMAVRMVRDNRVAERILSWQGDASATGDAVALRLAGTLHALVIDGQSRELAGVYPPNHDNVTDDTLWQAIDRAFVTHEDFILERLNSVPQTNEVRRAAILLPGFMMIARLNPFPFVLSELGASAGLNLHWDRFHYHLGNVSWGNNNASIKLAPRWEGNCVDVVPMQIHSRAGCDLNPLDTANPDNKNRLLSYLWPDQKERIARTKSAIDIAAASGIQVEKSDAIEWLEKRLAMQHQQAVHVIYHTITWQYFPKSRQVRGRELIKSAGSRATRTAPLAWLRFEVDGQTPGAGLYLTLWPTGKQHLLARADFHGRWIDWLGWPD